MKSNRLFACFVPFLTACAVCHHVWAGSNEIQVQDDPVLVQRITAPPVIDGIGDDACWQNAAWQSIDQVWFPYGGEVDSANYTGHYKILWSSATNLLYFLIEVTDDVFVDGYAPGVTADIYNYDISEVFIDENMSGGEHRYDGNGTNAENAFAYHMYAEIPGDGQVNTACIVDDMAGSTFNSWRADYTSHFPEFAIRVIEHTAVREFSLIVYNDTYTDANKDAARVTLSEGKEMGLSVAYCDNDAPDGNRDSMFGSVWEAAPGNMHWMNADGFGNVRLTSEGSGVIMNPLKTGNRLKLYPNPAGSEFSLQMDDGNRGEVSIRVFNLLGQCVAGSAGRKLADRFVQTLHSGNLPNGLYFVETLAGDRIYRGKLIVNHP